MLDFAAEALLACGALDKQALRDELSAAFELIDQLRLNFGDAGLLCACEVIDSRIGELMAAASLPAAAAVPAAVGTLWDAGAAHDKRAAQPQPGADGGTLSVRAAAAERRLHAAALARCSAPSGPASRAAATFIVSPSHVGEFIAKQCSRLLFLRAERGSTAAEAAARPAAFRREAVRGADASTRAHALRQKGFDWEERLLGDLQRAQPNVEVRIGGVSYASPVDLQNVAVNVLCRARSLTPDAARSAAWQAEREGVLLRCSLEAVANAPIGAALYQAKFEAPRELYDGALEAARAAGAIALGNLSPDFLLVRGADGGRARAIEVVDAKASSELKHEHAVQLTLYVLALQHIVPALLPAPDGAVSPALPPFARAAVETAAIWRPATAERDSIDVAAHAPIVLDFVRQSLPRLLPEGATFQAMEWHFCQSCAGCGFASACRAEAKERGTLSAIPYLSRARKQQLEMQHGVASIADLEDLVPAGALHLATARAGAAPPLGAGSSRAPARVRAPSRLQRLLDEVPQPEGLARELGVRGWMPSAAASDAAGAGAGEARPGGLAVAAPQSAKVLSLRDGKARLLGPPSLTLPQAEDLLVVVALFVDPRLAAIYGFSVRALASAPAPAGGAVGAGAADPAVLLEVTECASRTQLYGATAPAPVGSACGVATTSDFALERKLARELARALRLGTSEHPPRRVTVALCEAWEKSALVALLLRIAQAGRAGSAAGPAEAAEDAADALLCLSALTRDPRLLSFDAHADFLRHSHAPAPALAAAEPAEPRPEPKPAELTHAQQPAAARQRKREEAEERAEEFAPRLVVLVKEVAQLLAIDAAGVYTLEDCLRACCGEGAPADTTVGAGASGARQRMALDGMNGGADDGSLLSADRAYDSWLLERALGAKRVAQLLARRVEACARLLAGLRALVARLARAEGAPLSTFLPHAWAGRLHARPPRPFESAALSRLHFIAQLEVSSAFAQAVAKRARPLPTQRRTGDAILLRVAAVQEAAGAAASGGGGPAAGSGGGGAPVAAQGERCAGGQTALDALHSKAEAKWVRFELAEPNADFAAVQLEVLRAAATDSFKQFLLAPLAAQPPRTPAVHGAEAMSVREACELSPSLPLDVLTFCDLQYYELPPGSFGGVKGKQLLGVKGVELPAPADGGAGAAAAGESAQGGREVVRLKLQLFFSPKARAAPPHGPAASGRGAAGSGANGGGVLLPCSGVRALSAGQFVWLVPRFCNMNASTRLRALQALDRLAPPDDLNGAAAGSGARVRSGPSLRAGDCVDALTGDGRALLCGAIVLKPPDSGSEHGIVLRADSTCAPLRERVRLLGVTARMSPFEQLVCAPAELCTAGAFRHADAAANTAFRREAMRAYERYQPGPSQTASFDALLGSQLHVLWGPPGTGKTQHLAMAVLSLVEGAHAAGHPPLRIGVCAVTHHAILAVLARVNELRAAARSGAPPLRVCKLARELSLLRPRIEASGTRPARSGSRVRDHSGSEAELISAQQANRVPAGEERAYVVRFLESGQERTVRACQLAGCVEELATTNMAGVINYTRDATASCVIGFTAFQAAKHFSLQLNKGTDTGTQELVAAAPTAFDVLIVDEASQMPLFDAALVLPLVRADGGGRILVAGDHKQLQPIVHTDFSRVLQTTVHAIAGSDDATNVAGAARAEQPPLFRSLLDFAWAQATAVAEAQAANADLSASRGQPSGAAGVAGQLAAARPRTCAQLCENHRMARPLAALAALHYNQAYRPCADCGCCARCADEGEALLGSSLAQSAPASSDPAMPLADNCSIVCVLVHEPQAAMTTGVGGPSAAAALDGEAGEAGAVRDPEQHMRETEAAIAVKVVQMLAARWRTTDASSRVAIITPHHVRAA